MPRARGLIPKLLMHISRDPGSWAKVRWSGTVTRNLEILVSEEQDAVFPVISAEATWPGASVISGIGRRRPGHGPHS